MITPLEGLDLRTRPLATQGGYIYLQTTNDGDIHPGDDFNVGSGPNADCGVGVIAVRRSVVRHASWHITSTGRGFGNHVWLETDIGHFLHYCHLMNLPVREGDQLEVGQSFALCGRTVGWDFCHVHFEVRDTRPTDWNQWAGTWTYDRIAREYRDPYAWLLEYARGEEDMQGIVDELNAQVAALRAELDGANGINTELGKQVNSLQWLLGVSQKETSDRDAVIAQLQQATAPAVDVARVAVTLSDGREVVR